MPNVPEPFRPAQPVPRPELSRKLQLNSLGRREAGARSGSTEEIVVEASAEECRALARRLAVPAVAGLRCRFRLGGVDDHGRVSADGLLTATMTRVCVASLEEFEDEVVEAFRIRFVPAGDAADEEESLDPDADDDVPYEGTQLDLGEAAVEQLALAMQPYPRKPGVTLPSVSDDPDDDPSEAQDDDGEARPNPFAALKSRLR